MSDPITVTVSGLPAAGAISGKEFVELSQNGLSVRARVSDIAAHGKSAYEVAVDNGYEGSVATWIASLKGVKGDKGDTGERGQQGFQGLKGDTGSTGVKGDTGDTGGQGVKGDQGVAGVQGTQGIQGKSAYDVAVATGYVGTAAQWLASLKGTQGIQGERGIQGLKGDQGIQGLQGIQGVRGDAGMAGAAGAAGQTGAKGDQGIQGNQGIVGATGSSAYQVAVINGYTGNVSQWLASLKGDRGDTGPQGNPGATGPAGVTPAELTEFRTRLASAPLYSATPPSNPTSGQLWVDPADGHEYVWFVDADSSQWVETGMIGAENLKVATDRVNQAVALATVISDTPPANPARGARWVKKNNGREYVWNIADAGNGQWVETGAVIAIGYGTVEALGLYDGGSVIDLLDQAKTLSGYAALRTYTGRAQTVRITTSAVAGLFTLDTTDTTTLDNGGTILVDALGRRWKRVFEDTLRVNWFGATGQGVVDDFNAIQQAMVTATGKTLLFSAGTYNVSAQLTGVSNIRMIGAGRKLTRLVATAEMEALVFFLDKSGIQIEDIAFDGAAKTKSNIRSYAVTVADGLSIRRCEFTRTKNDETLQYGGVEVSQAGGRSRNVEIKESYFHDLGGHGAIIAYADAVVFDNGNFLENIGQHGMEAVNCQRVLIHGNIAKNCGTVGPGGSAFGVGSHTAHWTISTNVAIQCKGDAPITCEFTSNYGSIVNNEIYDSDANAGINVSYGDSMGNPAPFDRIQSIEILGNTVVCKPSITHAIGINIYSGPVIGKGIVCRGNTLTGFNVGIAAQYLTASSVDDNTILDLVENQAIRDDNGVVIPTSIAILSMWLTYSSVKGNKTNSTTGDHTFKFMNYGGSQCDVVDVADNIGFLSGVGATKSLIYIEGAGRFKTHANHTSGAAHYVHATDACKLQATNNFGDLTTQVPFFGATMVLINAQGNYNGLQDFTIVGGKKFISAAAAPTALAWNRGDYCRNNAPALNQPKGWICVQGGTPGIWLSEGNLVT